MTPETRVEDRTCLMPTFERNRYFFGKPLTVHDFETEQRYGISQRRVLNRLIHGTGILCGMKLSSPTVAGGKFTIQISEGAALDCCGNLIVVNSTDPVEVTGPLGDGTNYLYIKFAECVRQPIRASANVSSCEEVCCYNRVRETFEVFIGAKPATFTGTVKGKDGRAIFGAKVNALQAGLVRSETFTNNLGQFTLAVPSAATTPQFDVRVSATGFAPVIQQNQTPSATALNLVLEPRTATAATCPELTQRYFEEHTRVCPRCDDPKVFLAVVKFAEGNVTIDQVETDRVRSVVYSNPMLHDLLCEHLSDFNNPHRTTSEQVGALQSLNAVGNGPSRPYAANVDLASLDTTIEITPDNAHLKVDLKLANDAVRPVHLNNQTIETLLDHDNTITVQPNTGAKRILIKTNPAQTVSSVGTRVVGASPRYSPDDHSHDLADKAVTKLKLADEVINSLVTSDETLTVASDLGARRITIKSNPATGVTSVGREKVIGTSPRFARQDHVHNFLINERGPDADGNFRFRGGSNVSIVGGAAANELVINAEVSQAFMVTTGFVLFEGIRPGEMRASPPIKHGITAKDFAIVLGLDAQQSILTHESILIGDLQIAKATHPRLRATYRPNNDSFVIQLEDIRFAQTVTSYRIRWWAIPSTVEMEPVVSPSQLNPDQ